MTSRQEYISLMPLGGNISLTYVVKALLMYVTLLPINKLILEKNRTSVTCVEINFIEWLTSPDIDDFMSVRSHIYVAYAIKGSLTCQKRTYAGEKPYFCGMYRKRFAQVGRLTKYKGTQKREKPCICDICGKDFADVYIFATHMWTHTGEKPYVCNLCGKQFAHDSSLIQHRRVHTSERPYACHKCGESFAQVLCLCSHTGEKPYICDVRGKQLTQVDILSRHRRIHTG